MKTLVILTATYINSNMQQRFGKIPSVLTPFGEGTLLDKMYNDYSEYFDEIILVTFEGSLLLEKYIERYKLDMKICKLRTLDGLGQSLRAGLVMSASEKVTILFGDTYLSLEDLLKLEIKDSIGISIVNDSERWTIVNIINNKLEFTDKMELEEEKYFSIVNGSFHFQNVEALISLLNKYDFYDAIEKYSIDNEVCLVNTDSWVDLGNEDNFNFAKKNSSRYFNTINVNQSKGMLKKTSQNKVKFQHEIEWYLQLPITLKYLTPRIFDYSVENNNQYILMEYYSYDTLHEIYLYGNHSINKWSKIFDVLLNNLNEMKKYKYFIDSKDIKDSLEIMYYQKTIKRISQLTNNPDLKIFFENEEININGKIYKNLSYYTSILKRVIERVKLYDLEYFTIIHGDFFFANILYDMRSNFIRLVDPRGDFGGSGIYGDYRYDLAKLAHSVDGKYDLIIEDKFDVTINDNFIKLEVFSTSNQDRIKGVFYEKLSIEGVDIQQIKLIQSLLFLSMPPLHIESPRRQIAMIAIGIQLFDEVLEEKL